MDDRFVTSGGRVIGVTAVGESLESALKHAYIASEMISWNGMQFRRTLEGQARPQRRRVNSPATFFDNLRNLNAFRRLNPRQIFRETN
jgi:hypothetical protein